ncbi:MAG: hypothetical protein ACOVP1_09930 [Bacteroidia bacterium]
MKKSTLILFCCFSLFFLSCQKDTDLIPEDQSLSASDFIGTWNRDSVLLNEVSISGKRTRVESLVNNGTYLFNSDKSSGILSIAGDDYAITWSGATATITISEPDWLSQKYNTSLISGSKVKLVGTATIDGVLNERILYLSKK